MKFTLNLLVFFIVSGTFSSKDFGDTSITVTKLKRTTDVYTSEITHIRPLSMEVYTSEDFYTSTRVYHNVIKFEDGYNDEVWDYNEITDKHIGFSVAKMKTVNKFFPTTGFNGAEFDVIGSGNNQSNYRCTIASGSGLWISLSGDASENLGQNCHATFESIAKPTQAVIINLEEKTGKGWAKVDSYTVNVPQKWAIILDSSYQYGNEEKLEESTNFPALDACRRIGPRKDNGITTWQQAAGIRKADKQFRQQFMYRREELTNSPYADSEEYPEGNSIYFEHGNSNYSRDIDGTFMGEWGYVYDYKRSGWALNQRYWTVEQNSISYEGQFHVMAYGFVGSDDVNESFGVVCRGEFNTDPSYYIFKPEITHIKPRSMMVYTSDVDPDGKKKYGEYYSMLKFSKGYNKEVWDYDVDNEIHRGFSVAKMKATNKWFPTTGFNGAEFDIIGSGNDQSKYRCKIASGSGTWISLSGKASEELGENCRVTFDTFNKPSQTVTINLEYIYDNNWKKVDDYTINIPQKWGIVLDKEYQYADNDLNKATKFPALDACRQIGQSADYGTTTWSQGAGQNPEDRALRQHYMYRRDELTNSPYADRDENDSVLLNYKNNYSRDIDGTFMGEWGRIYDYEKSGWALNQRYWTAETNSDKEQFYVFIYGAVGYDFPNKTHAVVCRGE